MCVGSSSVADRHGWSSMISGFDISGCLNYHFVEQIDILAITIARTDTNSVVLEVSVPVPGVPQNLYQNMKLDNMCMLAALTVSYRFI